MTHCTKLAIPAYWFDIFAKHLASHTNIPELGADESVPFYADFETDPTSELFVQLYNGDPKDDESGPVVEVRIESNGMGPTKVSRWFDRIPSHILMNKDDEEWAIYLQRKEETEKEAA